MSKCSDDPATDVGGVLSALASRPRREILTRLCAGPATTTELARNVDLGLPAVHRHLDLLRDVGLVHSSKVGRTVTHTADLAPLSSIDTWIATRRSFWTNQLDALASALEEGS